MSYPDAVGEGWRDQVKQLDGQVSALIQKTRRLRAELRNAENAYTELANDIVVGAPDCWDGDDDGGYIARQYVAALEEVSLLAIGRMPRRGDDLRAMALVPDWADRAAAERDDDRGIDGDPDAEVRYDADGRGWHVRPAA